MAQKTVVTYTDDITGEPADETVRFGLDKAQYEIDLAEGNAKQLHDALLPYLEVARRVTTRKPRSGQPARPDPEQNQAIRDWAVRNGLLVKAKGRIPEELRIQYNNAHQRAL